MEPLLTWQRRMRADRWTAWPVVRIVTAQLMTPLLTTALLTTALVGCDAPGTTGPQRSAEDEALFAAPQAEFDRTHGTMTLGDIPNDPPAPNTRSDALDAELPLQAQRCLERARRFFAEQRYTETIREASTALRYNARIFEAHRLLALANQLLGRDDEARMHAERALEFEPGDLACHTVLARIADKQGDQEEALRQYRLALKCPVPDEQLSYRILVNYHLGMLLYDQGYYQAAIGQLAAFERGLTALGEAARGNPELATVARVRRGTAAMNLAHAYGLLGKHRQAAEALETAIPLVPTDTSLRRELVLALVRSRNLDRAAIAARDYVAVTRAVPEALELLAAVHRYAGQPEAAVDAVEQVIAQQPDNLELRLFYVDALLNADRKDEAEAALRALIEREPDLPEAQWKLIALQRARGQWTQWLTALARELAAHPDRRERAVQEVREVRPEHAGELVDQGLHSPIVVGEHIAFPEAVDGDWLGSAIDYLLGVLADDLGRPEDARVLFARSAERRPAFLPATLAVVRRDLDRCRWAEGLDRLAPARDALEAPDATVTLLTARCYDGLDQVAEARSHYEQAIEQAPDSAEARLGYARFLERMGANDQAVQQYEASLKLDPDNLEARERIVRLLWTSQDQTLRLVEEIGSMQRLNADAPATQRCLAMVRFLRPPNPDLGGYRNALDALVLRFPDDRLTRLELARTAMAQRDFAVAETHIDDLLAQRACDATANEMRLLLLKRRLRFSEAIDRLDTMLTWYPNRIAWLSERAQLLTFDQRYDEAMAIWERLLERTLRDEPEGQGRVRRVFLYQLRLMDTLRQAKRFAQARVLAEGWLKEAGEDHPLRGRLRWFVLTAEAGAKAWDRYLEQVRQWLTAAPEDRQLRGWLLGVTSHYPPGSPGLPLDDGGLIAAGRFDEAVLHVLKWLDEAATVKEGNGDGADTEDQRAEAQAHASDMMEWLIEILRKAGRFDEAIELARSHVAEAEQTELRINRLNLLKELHTAAGRYDDAIARSKEVIAETRKLLVETDLPRKAGIEAYLFDQRLALGQLYAQAKQGEEAIAHLREMIEEVDELRRQTRTLVEQMEDPRRRQQALKQIEDISERQTLLLRALSYAYQQEDRRDLAIKSMREAYELLPDDVGLNNDLGYTLAEAGQDLDAAERMVRLAVSEQPTQAAYLDSLGWVYYKQGDLERALTWLRRSAVMEDGEDPVIHDHLGDVYWRMGRKDEAVAQWRRSAAIHKERIARGKGRDDAPELAKVRAKLEAIEAGQTPQPASMPADTQPTP